MVTIPRAVAAAYERQDMAESAAAAFRRAKGATGMTRKRKSVIGALTARLFKSEPSPGRGNGRRPGDSVRTIANASKAPASSPVQFKRNPNVVPNRAPPISVRGETGTP